MSEIILHHYEMSPFSEKVRKYFAVKNMGWEAVEQPNIAPKPALTPLTGGYRRIPVMQIGAHIYCDTALIIDTLEARHPEPPLTPPHLRGAAAMLADWADHRVFTLAAGPTITEVIDLLPPEFLADRAKMTEGFAQQSAASITHRRNQLLQVCHQADRQLARSDWLLGDTLTLADLSLYHIVNFACMAPELGRLISAHKQLEAWRQRIAAMGQGNRRDMTQEEALDIARKAEIDETPPANAVEAINDGALRAGMQVKIQADDYGTESTEGVIVWLSATEIAVKRLDEQLGEIMVHYPLPGYKIEAVD